MSFIYNYHFSCFMMVAGIFTNFSQVCNELDMEEYYSIHFMVNAFYKSTFPMLKYLVFKQLLCDRQSQNQLLSIKNQDMT